MLRKLRARLTLLCAALCGLVVMGISAAALYATQTQYLDTCAQQNLRLVTQLAARVAAEQSISRTVLSQAEQSENAVVALWDSGQPLRWGGGPQRQALVDAAVEEAGRNGIELGQNGTASTASFLLEAQNAHWRCSAVRLPTDTGSVAVLVIQPRGPEFAHLARLWGLFCLIGLAGLAAVSLLGWVFAGLAIRPVQAAQTQQAQFIAAASHELRGPLAVIRADSEAARLRPEQTDDFLQGIDREAARMGRLVDELLLLARMDAGGWQIQAAALEPETLVIETADRFLAQAARRGMRLEILLPDQPLPCVQGDEQRLEQVLGIFVENALSYAPPGTCVTLQAARCGDWVELCCIDQGPGVPPALRRHIFEQFYRADSSRTDKQHFGLGLSVAAELAAAHGGSALVRAAQGGGACFVLRLPVRKG